MNKIIVFSCDPGTKNYAWSVSEYTKKGRKVLGCGMLEHTITSLIKEDLDSQISPYTKQIIKIINKYGPTHYVAERFQVRGMRQASIVECVTFMLGLNARICQKKKIDYTVIPASQWKNHFQKTYKPLEGIYEDGASYKIPPHVIDSNLIGWYIAQRLGYFSYVFLYKDYTKWLKLLQKYLNEDAECK